MRKNERISAIEALANAYVLVGFRNQLRMENGELVRGEIKGRKLFGTLLASGLIVARETSNEELEKGIGKGRRQRDGRIELAYTNKIGDTEPGVRTGSWYSEEASSIVWRELGKDQGAEGLGALVPVPNKDRFIGMRISPGTRQQIEELSFWHHEVREPEHVWYVEMEQPDRELPNGIMLWRGAGEEVKRTTMAAIWTQGPKASLEAPLIFVFIWEGEEETGRSEVFRIGTQTDDEELGLPEEGLVEKKTKEVSERGQKLLAGAMCLGTVTGKTELRGRTRTYGGSPLELLDRRKIRKEIGRLRTVHLAPVRRMAPPDRKKLERMRSGLDIAAQCARRTFEVLGKGVYGRNYEKHKTKWSAIEAGAMMWEIEAGKQEAIRQSKIPSTNTELLAMGKSPALDKLISVMSLAVARAQGVELEEAPRLDAILVPPKLWKSIELAGDLPEIKEECICDENGKGRAWCVEIEKPMREEPRMVGFWYEKTEERMEIHGVYLWTKGELASTEAPYVLGWVKNREEIGYAAAVIGLKPEIGQTDEDRINRVGKRRMEALAESNFDMRIMGAITTHIEDENRKKESGTPSIPETWRDQERRGSGRKSQGREIDDDNLFAIVRMGGSGTQGEEGDGKRQTSKTRGALEERQEVIAHWKRQVHGAGRKMRKVILVQSYERGPRPGEDQIMMRRLRERMGSEGKRFRTI